MATLNSQLETLAHCSKLGVQAKEMPRLLREGLAKKRLKAKGQKRGTTYSAA